MAKLHFILFAAFVFCPSVGISQLSQAGELETPVSFREHVAPLLVAKCQACHGARVAKGDFRLDSYARLMDEDSAAIEPGKPAESSLLDLLTSDDADTRMPKDGDPLAKEEIERIRRWIAAGAKYDAADVEAPLVEIMAPPRHVDPPASYSQPLPVTAVAFSPDGKELATSGYREILIWSADDGRLLRRIKNVAPRTYALAYSPDGGALAAGSGASGELGELRLFDPQSGELIKVVATLGDSVLDVKFSPDGSQLALSSADRTIRVYDAAGGERKNLIASHGDAVAAISFSPDGKRLAAVSLDRAAKIHDLAKNKAITSFNEHPAALYGVAFSADGQHVFSAGKEKLIRVWNAETGARLAEINDSTADVLKLIAADDMLFAAGADKRLRQFQLSDRKLVRAYEPTADWIYALAVHPARKRVAVGTFDGQALLSNYADGKQLLAFPAAPPAPDGKVTQAK